MKSIKYLPLALFLSGCAMFRVDPCNTSESISYITGVKDKIVCFLTVDSYDLNYKDKPLIDIYGKLSFPDEEKNLYNAIILSHGSGGLRRYHKKYVDLLNEAGYVVFQLDHYMGRGIKYDKTFSKVSGITFMNDAYKALNIIKTHPKINKIGYIGWSQGGVGPILSHFDKIVNKVSKVKFDATIAIYPYCGFTLNKDSATSTPLLMITGGSDDLTPEQACKNIYYKFSDEKNIIEHISIAGARHGFDNPFLYFGITFDNLPSLNIINDECTLTINDDGSIATITGKIVNGPSESERLLKECSTPGVHVKYSRHATETTSTAIINFLEKSF